jgi:hypothetical protein
MARNKHSPKEKTAFTRTASIMVENNIIQARNKYIRNVLEPWDKNMDWVLQRLFPEHILNYLRIGYEHTTNQARARTFCSWSILSNVSLQVRADFWHEQKILPPREEYMFDPKLVVPKLVMHCIRVREILYDYAKVSHVFNWFNHCSSSAIAMRNYCPWIQTVLPGGYHSCIEGTRFREPDNIGSILDLVKEVAYIMGRANLIQTDTPNKNKQGVTLYFSPTTFNEISISDYLMEC